MGELKIQLECQIIQMDKLKGYFMEKKYEVLNMQKKTGNNLICKNYSNLQHFKSHIPVGTNSPTKYNLINIFLLQPKPRISFQEEKKQKTLQSTD